MKSTGEASGEAAARSLRRMALRQVSGWLALSDAASIVVSWVLALALLRLFGPEAWWKGVMGWWMASNESRAALFSMLLDLMLVLFAALLHYSRRRPAADEVLDII